MSIPYQSLSKLIPSIRPFRSQPWGYSVTSPGLGSLDHPDHPTQTTKSIWDFRDEETSSRHVPRVQFVGRPHPGIMGTAPSLDLLSEWNRREKELYDVEMEKGRDCGVTLPLRKGAYVGQDLDEELRYRIYTQGARTGPARENGGNIDISSWVKGSKVYLVSVSLVTPYRGQVSISRPEMTVEYPIPQIPSPTLSFNYALPTLISSTCLSTRHPPSHFKSITPNTMNANSSRCLSPGPSSPLEIYTSPKATVNPQQQ